MKTFDLSDKKIDLFWSRINKSSKNKCWLWTGGAFQDGYGRISVKNKNARAHRVAYFIAYGNIPEGMLVCYDCDTPLCCNPDHLYLGTPADNRHDQDAKLRHYHGESVNTNKLTEAQVLEIRRIWDSTPNKWGLASRLSRIYNISDAHIGYIGKRKSWRHLP